MVSGLFLTSCSSGTESTATMNDSTVTAVDTPTATETVMDTVTVVDSTTVGQ